MRECRRVFSRRSLLWLLVLMAAVVFFHRVDHHNAPGFAAAYRQTVAQLAASPDPSAALSQMEAESRRYMTALLWRSTDDPDLLELYRDQARQVLGDDYEAAAMAYDLSDRAQAEFTARQQAQQTLRQQRRTPDIWLPSTKMPPTCPPCPFSWTAAPENSMRKT